MKLGEWFKGWVFKKFYSEPSTKIDIELYLDRLDEAVSIIEQHDVTISSNPHANLTRDFYYIAEPKKRRILELINYTTIKNEYNSPQSKLKVTLTADERKKIDRLFENDFLTSIDNAKVIIAEVRKAFSDLIKKY